AARGEAGPGGVQRRVIGEDLDPAVRRIADDLAGPGLEQHWVVGVDRHATNLAPGCTIVSGALRGRLPSAGRDDSHPAPRAAGLDRRLSTFSWPVGGRRALRGGHVDRSDPTLERARKDAKRLRREHEAGDPAALARADAALPARRPGPLKLADAQHVVAVER